MLKTATWTALGEPASFAQPNVHFLGDGKRRSARVGDQDHLSLRVLLPWLSFANPFLAQSGGGQAEKRIGGEAGWAIDEQRAVTPSSCQS
jgi:hypothetical protein